MEHEMYLKLADILLDDLTGRLNLHMPMEEKVHLAELALQRVVQENNDARYSKVYKDAKLRKAFIKQFFSYDEIDEFIHDYMVEDITVNGTGPICIHTTDKGFLSV